jgi:N-acetyl-beta-hexosaminidase
MAVARVGRFLESRGRRLIGWDEIIESGIPAGASIMSWRGAEGAIAAARAGHDVVMAPSPVLYLDHLQSDAPDEPPGRPAVESLEDVYDYEPVPADLTAAESSHVLGAQLNAWTEHMRLTERVEHQAFPRIAALAELTWSPAALRDWRFARAWVRNSRATESSASTSARGLHEPRIEDRPDRRVGRRHGGPGSRDPLHARWQRSVARVRPL